MIAHLFPGTAEITLKHKSGREKKVLFIMIHPLTLAVFFTGMFFAGWWVG